MNIPMWIILGLIVGILAQWFMPGKKRGGVIVTMLLGIAGAVVGGFLARLLGLGVVSGINLPSLAIATGGAVLVLYFFRLMAGK
ncbi:MAG: GlsB/YeaQ/YmgE family stress response membrane protein [bacterium]